MLHFIIWEILWFLAGIALALFVLAIVLFETFVTNPDFRRTIWEEMRKRRH